MKSKKPNLWIVPEAIEQINPSGTVSIRGRNHSGVILSVIKRSQRPDLYLVWCDDGIKRRYGAHELLPAGGEAA